MSGHGDAVALADAFDAMAAEYGAEGNRLEADGDIVRAASRTWACTIAGLAATAIRMQFGVAPTTAMQAQCADAMLAHPPKALRGIVAALGAPPPPRADGGKAAAAPHAARSA